MKPKVNSKIVGEEIAELVKLGSDLEDKILSKVDLKEALFETREKGLWLGGSKFIGEPIVFIVDDALWYFVAEICKEYYRETRGSYPKPHIINIEEKGDINKLVDLVELGEKVDSRIMIIRFLGRGKENLSQNLKTLIEDRDFNRVMRRVVNELFSQGLGFLILTINHSAKNANELIDTLSKNIGNYAEFYIPKLIKVKSAPVEAVFLMENMYGIEETSQKELRLETFSKTIAKAERKYRNLLERELEFNKYLYRVKLHKVGDKKESEDHLALKTLVVRNLIEKYGVIPEDIETEYNIENNAVADIYVKSQGWAIEVETLFDTGAAPILKIRDTVLKYKSSPETRKIWVIIRNMPALIHFRTILKLLKYLREEMKDKEIEFYTINVEKGSLIDILEIRKHLLRTLISLRKRNIKAIT